jgi:hypothetical protein
MRGLREATVTQGVRTPAGAYEAESYVTRFGSLDDYDKGGVEIINDDPRHYAFSNVFEVAATSKPYEKVAVAKNMEYVLEAIRAEGVSAWRTASPTFLTRDSVRGTAVRRA